MRPNYSSFFEHTLYPTSRLVLQYKWHRGLQKAWLDCSASRE